jgi:hypothetical protein
MVSGLIIPAWAWAARARVGNKSREGIGWIPSVLSGTLMAFFKYDLVSINYGNCRMKRFGKNANFFGKDAGQKVFQDNEVES